MMWLRTLLMALLMVWPVASQAQTTVFAAASLTNALEAVGQAYTQATGQAVRFSFAGSSALARQIEAGAPADLFIAADLEWMDYVAQRNLIQPKSRRNLLSNRLVLIAPQNSALKLGRDIAAALGADGRLAMADPDFVPAGRYGKAALISLDQWPRLEQRLARTENVRAALLLVARGETPLGLVYATDALADPKVRVVRAIAPNTHPPIVYPTALTTNAKPEAQRFLAFLQSPTARAIFAKQGFGVLR
jgi:molybdate transport system substrate-binding protein